MMEIRIMTFEFEVVNSESTLELLCAASCCVECGFVKFHDDYGVLSHVFYMPISVIKKGEAVPCVSSETLNATLPVHYSSD